MIREAQYVERVPYMLVIDEKEASEQNISVRSRDTGKTEAMTAERFIWEACKAVKDRI